MPISISIIIPTCNEEQHIASTIQLIQERAASKENLQIIVADGGSTDYTVAKAQQAGACIIHATQTRRSIQMNEGARAADYPVFYFLHADTHPPLHFDQIIAEIISDGYNAGLEQSQLHALYKKWVQ